MKRKLTLGYKRFRIKIELENLQKDSFFFSKEKKSFGRFSKFNFLSKPIFNS